MKLSRAELVALAAHSSDDTTRPHVCCLHVKAGLVEATDGHRCARLQTGDDKDSLVDYIIPRVAVEKVIKACPKRGVIVTAPGNWLVYSDVGLDGEPVGDPVGVSFTIDLDLKFPPTGAVFPVRDESSIGGSVHVNPEYLADLAHVSRATERKEEDAHGKIAKVCSAIEIYTSLAELDPIFFRCVDPSRGRTWTIVVMPVRPPWRLTKRERVEALNKAIASL